MTMRATPKASDRLALNGDVGAAIGSRQLVAEGDDFHVQRGT